MIDPPTKTEWTRFIQVQPTDAGPRGGLTMLRGGSSLATRFACWVGPWAAGGGGPVPFTPYNVGFGWAGTPFFFSRASFRNTDVDEPCGGYGVPVKFTVQIVEEVVDPSPSTISSTILSTVDLTCAATAIDTNTVAVPADYFDGTNNHNFYVRLISVEIPWL